MSITTAVYSFRLDKVVIQEPYKIEKETDKCYFTKNGRYLKSNLGKPAVKYVTTQTPFKTSYPYIEVAMVDADETALRNKLSEWFADKAREI